MTLNDYQKWIDLNHEHALVEFDLREVVGSDDDVSAFAERILFERFGA